MERGKSDTSKTTDNEKQLDTKLIYWEEFSLSLEEHWKAFDNWRQNPNHGSSIRQLR